MVSRQHGDYHVSNFIITETDELVVIDFNRCSVGNPWAVPFGDNELEAMRKTVMQYLRRMKTFQHMSRGGTPRREHQSEF